VGPLKTPFDPDLPWWADYLPYVKQIRDTGLPRCEQLNTLLPPGLKTGSGKPIRFVPSTALDDGPYEERIYTTGKVSTRPDNWHDVFNALVWMRFPCLKATMNTLHFHALSEQRGGMRGKLRDALTLFDECGVIVFSRRANLLDALAERRWVDVFTADHFSTDVQIAVCGHAMLEKYLAPYKSMTAKALLVTAGEECQAMSRTDMLTCLDAILARRLLAGSLLTKPASLTPLPMAGIPGWWPWCKQDEKFYDDPQVFRPPPADLAPVHLTKL